MNVASATYFMEFSSSLTIKEGNQIYKKVLNIFIWKLDELLFLVIINWSVVYFSYSISTTTTQFF